MVATVTGYRYHISLSEVQKTIVASSVQAVVSAKQVMNIVSGLYSVGRYCNRNVPTNSIFLKLTYSLVHSLST